MKTFILSILLLPLGSLLLASETNAATYPGQACQSKTAGKPLAYLAYAARNSNSTSILITCPVARVKDSGTGAVDSVIYFTNDGRTKYCTFENFNINTAGFGVWVSANGIRRLAFPTLSPTLQWNPFTFDCLLPAASSVIGYHVSER